MESRYCESLKADGTSCRSLALPSGSYCWAHDPEMAAERRRARAQGGANSARSRRLSKLMPERLRPVWDLLEKALTETHAGTLEPRVASAMASLASAMCKVVQLGEMETRLRDVEVALKKGGSQQ